MDQRAKAALAWFIRNDDTYSGGDWEEGNQYWLSRRRAALCFFKDYTEIERLAHEYDEMIDQGKITVLSEAEEKAF